MKVVLIHGHVVDALKQIPSDSVDCVITSPPYYGLRKYPEDANVIWGGDPNCEHEWESLETKRPNLSGGKDNPYAKEKLAIKGTDNYKEQVDYHKRVTVSSFCKKCGAWYGQLGLEPTPEMYVEHLGMIFKEVYRVLKPTGTFWLNIGDTYSGGSGHNVERINPKIARTDGKVTDSERPQRRLKGIPRKCMLCIPERVLFKCLEIGFILRNKIIWYKPNHMPSSVKDRLTNTWEYVYLLTKKQKYYFNLDAIRVPYVTFEKERKHDIKRMLKYGGFLNPVKIGYESKYANTLIGAFNSKFLKSDVKTGSPAQRTIKVLMSGKLTTKVRRAIEGLANYLRMKKKQSGYTIKELAELTGIKKTTLEHYFRNDEWFAIPDKGAWEALKPLLGLGEYEDFVTEEIRSALPQIHPLGKNPGDMWSINTEPFPEAHFAVFPTELVRRCMKAGCPPDGTVLDPFVGSGTTVKVAIELRRNVIGIDVVKEYIKMTMRRCNLPNPFIEFKLITC